MKIIAIVILAFGAFGGGWKLLVHGTNVPPAIVRPQTNVRMEFSGDPIARIYRATHDVAAGDRAKRPRLIALTFDDGPYPVYTPMLLDVLRDLHVPATFFLIGQDALQWPEITKRIEAEGHEVADHTFTHPNLDQETSAQVRNEVLEGRDALWSLTHDPGVRRYMRPPHGRYTEQTLEVVQSLGYSVVLWTDDSGDWRSLTERQIERHLIYHATAPDIVLLHSGKLATIEALPAVVERFRQAGYTFVTVGQLLERVTTNDIDHPLRKPV